jgi:hypothetical protein
MSDPRPPDPKEEPRRIEDRDPNSAFARFPEHEVDPISQPGGGPRGGVGSGVNPPVILIVAGIVVALLTLVVNSPWLLLLGLVMVVCGGVWSRVRKPPVGHMEGLGKTDPE